MNDQADRLRNKIGREPKRAKTIAIVSGKGGVGKSNTVLNLSIELQNRGKKVLLIDLDVGMGNIDILIGNDATYSIVHLFNEFIPLHDIIEEGPANMSYIAGGTSLNELLQLDERKLNYFFEQYDQITTEYDFIFLDLGAGVSESSMSFILAADECFVITTPEPTAITDAYSMIKHIVRHQKDIPLYVIMNRSPRQRTGKKMLQKFDQLVHQFLNKNVIQLGTIPNDNVVQKAVIAQTPYLLYAKGSSVSKAIRTITSAYLGSQRNKTEEKQVSFIDRLKRLLKTR